MALYDAASNICQALGYGGAAPTWKATLPAVRKALQAELLMPLRALTECDLTSTMAGRCRLTLCNPS
jgi:hypothetical protein